MSESRNLGPITLDSSIFEKCKAAMDKWSANRAFTMTKTLGSDATITKAVMYHAYEFKLESKWTHREFRLEDSGTPVSNPKDIGSYELWDTSLHGIDEDCDLELEDTCYKTECERCSGKGQYTCTQCNGDKKVACGECGGSGQADCGKCDGSGQVDCPTCGGKGRTYCPHCNGGGKIGAFEKTTLKSADCGYCGHTGKVTCSRCNGGKKETCTSCGGSGKTTCKECRGSGEVICETCNGSGIETCSHCDGRGWIPHVWHLVQEQKSDKAASLWFDEGTAYGKEADVYASYTAETLVEDVRDDGSRTDQSAAGAFDAPFVEELKTLWKDSDGKLKMATGTRDADRFRYQHAVLKQYDAVIRVEYTYKDKPYIIWVDLCGDDVYEGPDGGLMAEWAKEVAEAGDKAAEDGDTPEAMYKYTMACAITDKDTEISERANKYLNRQAWNFRIAAAVAMFVCWGGFGIRIKGAQGFVGALLAAGVFVLGDWLALKRKIWLSAIGQALVLAAGFVGYNATVGESAANLDNPTPMTDFAIGCSLAFGSMVLLLAHDFALRFRYGKIPHKRIMTVLGALVGWAASPAIALGCSAHPETWGTAAKSIGIVLLACAAWRTLSRLRVIDCGRWIDRIKNPVKKRAFVNSFAELKPAWLFKCVFIVLIAWIPLSMCLSFVSPKAKTSSQTTEPDTPSIVEQSSETTQTPVPEDVSLETMEKSIPEDVSLENLEKVLPEDESMDIKGMMNGAID